ncbi:hypothetical protein [Paenibacillus sp. yr247]|uniref:hypothetical protein n=1 Tax=Paenibacillus sp. yr247 TaxID=1761880 RepID=UPI000B845E70|nr:hypothetical protein [Paenibacillus sp. yr247]
MQSEVEKWLSSISGAVGSLNIEPDNGLGIKIELAPPLKIKNKWITGTVAEVVLFISQTETYYPTLLIFTKEDSVIAVSINHDLKVFLKTNNLYNPELNLNNPSNKNNKQSPMTTPIFFQKVVAIYVISMYDTAINKTLTIPTFLY